MLLEDSTERRMWGHFTGHTLGERKETTSFSGIVQIDQEANWDFIVNSRCNVCKQQTSLSSRLIYQPCCGGMPILRGFFVDKGLLHIKGRPRTHD